MGVMHEMAKKLGSALDTVHAGEDKIASRRLGSHETRTLDVSSAAFEQGNPLPLSATADGQGLPPIVRWSGIPKATQSLVLVCEDPDAPIPQPFVHWLVHGIPARDGALDDTTLAAARQGQNTKLVTGFTPASPPPGHGPHHYHFQVFALDTTLGLDDGVGRTALLEAMDGHVIAWGDLVGTYERN